MGTAAGRCMCDDRTASITCWAPERTVHTAGFHESGDGGIYVRVDLCLNWIREVTGGCRYWLQEGLPNGLPHTSQPAQYLALQSAIGIPTSSVSCSQWVLSHPSSPGTYGPSTPGGSVLQRGARTTADSRTFICIRAQREAHRPVAGTGRAGPVVGGRNTHHAGQRLARPNKGGDLEKITGAMSTLRPDRLLVPAASPPRSRWAASCWQTAAAAPGS